MHSLSGVYSDQWPADTVWPLSALPVAGMAMAMKWLQAGNVQSLNPLSRLALHTRPGPPTRSQNILMRILEIIHRKPGPDTRGHAPLIDDALRAEYDQRTIKKTIASIDEESRGISLCFEEDRASKRFEILSDSNSFRSFVGKVSLTHSRSLTLS